MEMGPQRAQEKAQWTERLGPSTTHQADGSGGCCDAGEHWVRPGSEEFVCILQGVERAMNQGCEDEGRDRRPERQAEGARLRQLVGQQEPEAGTEVRRRQARGRQGLGRSRVEDHPGAHFAQEAEPRPLPPNAAQGDRPSGHRPGARPRGCMQGREAQRWKLAPCLTASGQERTAHQTQRAR